MDSEVSEVYGRHGFKVRTRPPGTGPLGDGEWVRDVPPPPPWWREAALDALPYVGFALLAALVWLLLYQYGAALQADTECGDRCWPRSYRLMQDGACACAPSPAPTEQ